MTTCCACDYALSRLRGDRAKQLKIREKTNDFLAVRLKSANGRHLHDFSAVFSNVNALGLEHNDRDFCPAFVVIGILWDLDPYRRRFTDSTTTDRRRKYCVSRSNVGSISDAAADEPLLLAGAACPVLSLRCQERE